MMSLLYFVEVILLFHTVTGNCPSISSPQNGNVVVGGKLTGQQAAFSCLPNFFLSGPSVITCSNMNTWIPDPPKCSEVVCGALESPSKGSVSDNARKASKIGTIATFNCDPGYFLQGPSKITCKNAEHYGVWNGYYPVCLSRAPKMPGYAMSAGSCLGHEDLLASSVLDPFECATRCSNDPSCKAFNIYTTGAGYLTCQPMTYACSPSELKLPEDQTRFYYTRTVAATRN